MSKRGKKGQSLARQIKRGHVKGVINKALGCVDFYRRTSNSREHTVLVDRIKVED